MQVRTRDFATNRRVPVFLFAMVLMAPLAAQAGKESHGWQYSFAPMFVWGMGIDGDTRVGPSAAPLDIRFKDALSNLDAVLTFHFEAQKDDLTLLAEYQFVDLSPSAELPDGSTVDVGFKNKMGELGVAYRVAEYGRSDLEILGGARYVSQELSVNGIPVPPLSSLKNKEDWWDGFVGGRIKTRLSEHWRFVGRVDFGTGGSDRVWNLVGMFDYRFRDWGSAFVGYKWMDFDYSSGSGLDLYEYDATQEGPLAGFAIHW
jgi:hypothetical protein